MKTARLAKIYALVTQGIFTVLLLIGLGFFIGYKISHEFVLAGVLAGIGAIVGIIIFIMLIMRLGGDEDGRNA